MPSVIGLLPGPHYGHIPIVAIPEIHLFLHMYSKTKVNVKNKVLCQHFQQLKMVE